MCRLIYAPVIICFVPACHSFLLKLYLYNCAPIPTAPIPTAPIPTAPLPTAPIPTALIPSAPIPTAPITTAIKVCISKTHNNHIIKYINVTKAQVTSHQFCGACKRLTSLQHL